MIWPMRFEGVHILLTYGCNLECDHFFVWSGPGAQAALALPRLKRILDAGQTYGAPR